MAEQEILIDGVPHLADVRPATAEEQFLLELDRDNFKQSVPRLNEAIGRLLTLATGMTGGAIGLLKDDVCTGWGRVLAAAAFAAALGTAAVAAVPFQRRVDRVPDDIAAAMDAAQARKRRSLWAVTACIAAGLLAAVAGLAVKAWG